MTKILIFCETGDDIFISLALMNTHFNANTGFYIYLSESTVGDEFMLMKEFCKHLNRGQLIKRTIFIWSNRKNTWMDDELCSFLRRCEDSEIILYVFQLSSTVDMMWNSQYSSKIRCAFVNDHIFFDQDIFQMRQNIFSLGCCKHPNENTDSSLEKICKYLNLAPSEIMKWILDSGGYNCHKAIDESLYSHHILMTCASFDTVQGFGIDPPDCLYFYVVSDKKCVWTPRNTCRLFDHPGIPYIEYKGFIYRAIENVLIQTLCQPECSE